jgi:acyl-CoA hydrolase
MLQAFLIPISDKLMTQSLEQIIEARKVLSQTRVTKAIFPDRTNHHNTLFGGTALQWMDEVSFIAATRFSRQNIVTVSSDKIDFKHPVPGGSVVELIAQVVEVGRSSIRVQVDVFVEGLYQDGCQKAITGFFSFVAIGEDKKPTSALPKDFLDLQNFKD